MKIHHLDDYKAAIRALVTDRRSRFGGRFTYERMAAACGVQKTYFSKVMNGAAQLNPDQLFSAGEFLKLGGEDLDYLLLLREWQLAGNPRREAALKAKLQQVRRRRMKTEAEIQIDENRTVEEHSWEYYSDIDLQLVHLFLTIPKFAAAPALICEKIGIKGPRLEEILLKLQNWGIARFEQGRYLVQNPRQHLREDAPVIVVFGILNRLKTIEKLRQIGVHRGEDYLFSAVFSADAAFHGVLRSRLIELIRDAQAHVGLAKPEELFQLNIDFFRWS